MNASWPLLRSVAFGGVAVLVSLAGHVSAGGATPDAASLLLALAITVAGYRILLARRERSLIVLTGSLALVELALHELFMAWAAGPAMSGGMGPSMGGDGVGPSMASWPSPTMVLAHGLAAVLLAGVLRQGEAALWSAARRGVARLWQPVLDAVARVVATWAGLSPLRSSRGPDRQEATDLGRWTSRWATAGRARRGPPRYRLDNA